MMRKCHLNTCPVGIATQNPELRRRFTGQPEHVINYFFFVAEEVRLLMAQLGFRSMDEMIGRVDMIEMRPAVDHWKAHGLDFSEILYNPRVPGRVGRRCTLAQDHGLSQVLDHRLMKRAKSSIESGERNEFQMPISNVHRTTGAMLSGAIVRQHGSKGLPDDTLKISFAGSAGQSFGAFLAKGVSMFLEGDANDYVGKGLSGGKIIVYPPKDSTFAPEENILIGNTVLYGATSGEAYFGGVAGERFAVRNSGATAVVEGVGDHGCEYMTNGVVVVLGRTGRNFAAGMSGGLAYVYDPDGEFNRFRCNKAGVDLEPLFEREDLKRLETLISRHVAYTGSPLGKRLLENWGETVSRMVKIFPHEYKRVLGVLKSAEQRKAPAAQLPADPVIAIGEAAR
jgi:glutamate synthase domain-containing protein 3